MITLNIFEILREKEYDTVPGNFYSHISIWKSWYDGEVKDFHRYSVYNGMNRVQCHRYTMGMAKKVAEDWANLLANEKTKITLEGSAEQAFLDGILEKNNFRVKLNEMQELKSALGTVAYIPRVVGASINEATGKIVGKARTIALDYCTAENIFPLSWENGIVKECAFGSEKIVNNKKYLYLQIHRLENDLYVIENLLFENHDGELKEVVKSDVRGFENVPDLVHTNSAERQFVIDRPNIANNVDYTLPMGIPVFANAIDNLKGVDIAYDSYVNEFVLGKKRIMVKPEATKDLDGEPLFDAKDTVYYVLPEDTSNGSIIDPIDMSLRTAEHNAGIQDMLNVLSSKCGFGENHYKYDNGNISTATQVISENSSMFRTLKKHEIVLDSVLKELCRIILRMGNTYMSAGLNENVEISIDFDDSIIEDKDKEFSRDCTMLANGTLNAWEFRAKWMNEDEATAKAALPQMEDLVKDNVA